MQVLADPVRLADLPIPLSIAVGIVLVDPNWTEPVQAIHQADLAMPLTIESTARAMLEASTLVRQNLELLRELNNRKALDDFGTGHSSRPQPCERRPHELKIDRSFVAAMEHDPHAQHSVQAITNLAGILAFDLVAQGVKDQNIQRTLAHLSVDRFQGHLLTTPLG